VTNTATPTAGAAPTNDANSPTSQTATAGTAVSAPPSVLVKDGNGNPVAGVVVTFTPATGSGTVTGGSQTTNGNGVATVGSWTLSATAGSNTLTATSGSLSGSPVTFTAQGTAGAATTIAANSPTSQTATAGTAVSAPPSVLVKDANGNPVAGAAVTFTPATGSGTVTGGSQTTNGNGVATVGSWTLSATAGSNTLTATSGSLAGSPVTFTATGTAGAAATIAANSPTSQSAPAGTAVSAPPSVLVKDANGNPVPGVAVTFAVASGNGSVTGGSQTTNGSGIASVGSWTLNQTVGTNTLTATASGSGITGNPVTFTADGTPGTATQLAFTGPPSNTPAGAVITPPVQVTARDAFGNTATQFTGNITLAIPANANPGGGTLSGTKIMAAVAGLATFSDLSINNAGNGYRLRATSSGLTAVNSAVFNITIVTPTQLVFTVPPSNATAGTAITPAVRVTAEDAAGNTATTFTGNVTLAIGTNPGGGTLTGGGPVAAVSGVATFSSVSIDKAGTGYTLTASSGTLGGTSPAFNITGSSTVSASQSTVVATSPITAGGAASTITVTAEDAFGNPIADATVTLAATPATGNTLTQPVGTTDANGVATGTLSSTVAGSKSVSATINTVAITQTATVVVNPGPAATIGANSPTSQTAAAGTAVSSPPSVIVKDTNGNPVAGVSVTFAPAVGSGTVTGGSQTTTASGIATVGSWTLSPTAGTNTLTATSSGLTGSPVTFTADGTAGAATQLVITTPPSSSAQSGVALAQQPVVQLQDANNNPVSQSGVTVTASVASGPNGATLSNATATTGSTGAAPFSGLTISGPAGSYTLSFGASGLTPATSGTIALTAAATTTTITGHSPDPSVFGQAITVSYSVTSGSGTPTGTVTVSDGTDSCSGTVAQGSCSLTPSSAGSVTLTAAYAGDANFASSTSAGVGQTVNPAATTTTITSETPDPSTVGGAVTFAFTVAANAPGSGTATGTVTVSDGAQSCSASVAVGTCNIAFNTAGARTVTATYAGDGNFAGSTSAGVGHTVNQAPTTTTIIGVAPEPSVLTQPITISFTVTSSGGTPTGNVTVTDGTVSCTATVADGSCSMIPLAAGTETLVATYGGDANFLGSTSAPFAHTVNLTP
jgi:hypothetical protein